MQYIEHLGKLQHSAHKKCRLYSSFNLISCKHIAFTIFGICKEVQHFSNTPMMSLTINGHNGQLVLHTNSSASASGTEGQYCAPNPNYCRVKWPPPHFLLRMADTITSQIGISNIYVIEWLGIKCLQMCQVCLVSLFLCPYPPITRLLNEIMCFWGLTHFSAM